MTYDNPNPLANPLNSQNLHRFVGCFRKDLNATLPDPVMPTLNYDMPLPNTTIEGLSRNALDFRDYAPTWNNRDIYSLHSNNLENGSKLSRKDIEYNEMVAKGNMELSANITQDQLEMIEMFDKWHPTKWVDESKKVNSMPS